jgi:putative membrane protein
MLKLFATTATVALLALGGPALAQTSPSTQRPAATTSTPSTTSNADQTKKNVDHGDKTFMEHAAKGGAKEIALGKLAEQKAENPEVKKLAETIVKDHTEASQKLEPIAQKMGVDLKDEMAEGKKDDYDDFQKLSGADFDRKYVAEMIDDHKDATKEFDDAAKNAKDPELKAWAGEVAPKLHQHLQMAEAAQKALQPKTTSSGTPSPTTGSSTAPGTAAPSAGGTTTTKPSR